MLVNYGCINTVGHIKPYLMTVKYFNIMKNQPKVHAFLCGVFLGCSVLRSSTIWRCPSFNQIMLGILQSVDGFNAAPVAIRGSEW